MPAREYNPAKRAANLPNHEMDFDSAQGLGDDPDRIEIPARTTPEPHTLIIARWSGKMWSAIATSRQSVIKVGLAERCRQVA